MPWARSRPITPISSLRQENPWHHRVTLDSVIAAMAETGREMNAKFKETSLGGLAVSMVNC